MISRAAIVLVLAGACSRSDATPRDDRSPPSHVDAALDPPQDDDPIAALARTNRTCEACHPVHAQEWRASKHRSAFTDEAFATAYARTPFRFCRDCHAPHAKGTPDDARLDAWVADNGVACVTCHVPEAGERVGPGASHPLLRPIPADSGACAGCHEFRFPDAETLDGAADDSVVAATLMQRTLWEHARSPFADTSCASCHMPEVREGEKRHRDHRFAHDDERLRAAITVTASRPRPDRVVLDLSPIGVGHAFPTGDLFRRLELKIERADTGGVTRRYLGRHFPPRRRGAPYVRNPPLEADDRLVAPRAFAFDLPGARVEDALTWSVTYQRVDHRVAEAPQRSTLHGQTVLASGRL